MNNTNRTAIMVVLGLAALVFAVMFFSQSGTVGELEDSITGMESERDSANTQLTQVAEERETQVAELSGASESLAATATQLASDLSDAQAEATEQAELATQSAESLVATATQFASDLSDAQAEATQEAESAAATATEIAMQLNSALEVASDSSTALESLAATATRQAETQTELEEQFDVTQTAIMDNMDQMRSTIADMQATATQASEDAIATATAHIENLSNAEATVGAVAGQLEALGTASADEFNLRSTAEAAATQMAQELAVLDAAAQLDNQDQIEAEATGTQLASDVVALQSTIEVLNNTVATLDASVIDIPDTMPEEGIITTEFGNLERVTTSDIELYLPAGFLTADPRLDLQTLAQELVTYGANYQGFINELRRTLGDVALISINPIPNADLTVESIEAAKDTPGVDLTLDEYVVLNRDDRGNITIISEEVVMLGDVEAIRIISEINRGVNSTGQLQYYIKRGDDFWRLTYTTSIQLFEARLPLYLASVETLQFVEGGSD